MENLRCKICCTVTLLQYENLKNYLQKNRKLEELFPICKSVALLHCCKNGTLEELFPRKSAVLSHVKFISKMLHCCIVARLGNLKNYLSDVKFLHCCIVGRLGNLNNYL